MIIAGLPAHIAEVPEGPVGVDSPVEGFSFPIDRDRGQKVRNWEKWAAQVLEFRTDIWRKIKAGDRKTIAEQRYLLATIPDPKYFITIFCSVYDTRPENIERLPWAAQYPEGWLPAILYPRQYEFCDWIMETLKGRGSRANGAVSKSREVGATSVMMLVCTWAFVFLKPFSAKFISKEEADVDMLGDIDSMMERGRALLYPGDNNPVIPSVILPGEFTPSLTKHLLMRHPKNRNRMRGHSTTGRATRAGRARLMVIDEGAHMDEGILTRLLTAVMNTAPHLVVMTSESAEYGDEFIEWRQGLPPESVFVFDFWHIPYHDTAWFRDMLERFREDIAGLYREVLRDAYRGFEGWMYSEARNMEVLPGLARPEDFPEARIWVGMDPGQADDCVLGWLMETHDQDIMLDAFESSGKPPEYYAAIIAGILPNEIIETVDYRPLHNIHWAPAVIDKIKWVKTLPPPKALCGDPYGANVMAGDSWYGKMKKFWKRHDVAPIPIRINWKPEARHDQGRRNALHAWLLSDRLKFNNTPGARRVLNALQKSRWDPTRRSRQQELKNAPHDEFSHLRTMAEFLAVNLETAAILAARGRATPVIAGRTELTDGSANGNARIARPRPRSAPLSARGNARGLTGSDAAAAAWHAANRQQSAYSGDGGSSTS